MGHLHSSTKCMVATAKYSSHTKKQTTYFLALCYQLTVYFVVSERKQSFVTAVTYPSNLQVQVMDFFFFHLLFKNALCSQVKGFRPHGLLVYRLCLPPDTPIIIVSLNCNHESFIQPRVNIYQSVRKPEMKSNCV